MQTMLITRYKRTLRGWKAVSVGFVSHFEDVLSWGEVERISPHTRVLLTHDGEVVKAERKGLLSRIVWEAIK